MWIIKLGGSLMRSSHLPTWLQTCHALRGQGIVIVPGGGPFADQVRRAQQDWHFDDDAAHRMAILAMEQYGQLLAALLPTASLARTQAEIQAALVAGGRVVIWLPAEMLVYARIADPRIQADWGMSSDSLGLWLACRLDAAHFVLIKSGSAVASADPGPDLVDSRFADLARTYPGCIHLFREMQSDDLLALVNGTGS